MQPQSNTICKHTPRALAQVTGAVAEVERDGSLETPTDNSNQILFAGLAFYVFGFLIGCGFYVGGHIYSACSLSLFVFVTAHRALIQFGAKFELL